MLNVIVDVIDVNKKTLININKSMYHRRDSDFVKKDFSSVPPPENLNKRQSYTNVSQLSSNSSDYKNASRKRGITEDDYFNDDDESESNYLESETNKEAGFSKEDDDEEDPLDAFMASLESDSKKSSQKNVHSAPLSMKVNVKPSKAQNLKGIRDDIESEDAEESYYKYMEENPNAGVGTFAHDEDEDEIDKIEYDEEGNPIVQTKLVVPLPPTYHSEINYETFEKNFYEEHEDIAKLSSNEIVELRKKLGIHVSGPSPPKPVTSFGHFGFDELLMKTIRKSEYAQPTPIQAQAIPAALNGRDIIGIAKTGSGKTAAFVWPLIVHILDQKELKLGDGPIGLILAPTRELALQIYTEAKKFGKPYNISVVCAYGGGNKYEQSKDLEAGAEIVVATPVSLF